MSKEDTEKKGLLSRVVKLVRGANASDDPEKSNGERSYSKQSLKEMLERKQRNDLVRQREFNMLRKIRRREPLTPAEQGYLPSLFQSSHPSNPDARAITLKKIDEVEAQMVLHWRNKTAAPPALQPPNAGDANRAGSTPESATSASFSTDVASEATDEFGSTRLMLTTPPRRLIRNQAAPPLLNGLMAGYEVGSGGFSPSKLYAVEVEEVAYDAELEEAAIRFANGDVQGAESNLLESVRANSDRAHHQEIWLALFDLYRAAGKQDEFEQLALDFAIRFSRSTPSWHSLPDEIQQTSAGTSQPSKSGADWTSPAVLTRKSAESLQSIAAAGPLCLTLNWSPLQKIDADAAPLLQHLFSSWTAHQIKLQFSGCAELERVLSAATPPGEKSIDPLWWRLRLDTMRLWHRPDKFEMLALDYCVTYEVSPPAWERARCAFKSLDQNEPGKAAPSTVLGNWSKNPTEISTGFGETPILMDRDASHSPKQPVEPLELTGIMQGDISPLLDTLGTKLNSTPMAKATPIFCNRLIRIDFSAVGALLNWVSYQHESGRTIHFCDAHRLVAAFLHVIGIDEYAQITVWKD